MNYTRCCNTFFYSVQFSIIRYSFSGKDNIRNKSNVPQFGSRYFLVFGIPRSSFSQLVLNLYFVVSNLFSSITDLSLEICHSYFSFFQQTPIPSPSLSIPLTSSLIKSIFGIELVFPFIIYLVFP